MRLLLALLCASIAVGWAFGCGSNSDETVARADFVQKANAICAKADRQRGNAVAKAVNKQKASGGELESAAFNEALILKVALPPLAQMTDELEQLGAPDSDAEAASAIVDSFRAGISQVEENPAKFLKVTSDPFADAKKQAKAYGLPACSSI